MFKKQYRLNTSLFKEVFNFGKTHKEEFFLIKQKKNDIKHSRFAVVVSKKIEKKAVKRNYLKRRVFAALKQVYKDFPKADYVFILNSGVKDIQYKELITVLKHIKL